MVQPQPDTAASKAAEIASAVAVVWAAKGQSPDLAQTNKDGLTLRLKALPAPVLNKQGAVIGIDAWVQLFDVKGNEIPIDPHRRIVNPPLLVPDGGVGAKGKATYSRDPAGAYWAVLWDSVLTNPNPDEWVKS